MKSIFCEPIPLIDLNTMPDTPNREHIWSNLMKLGLSANIKRYLSDFEALVERIGPLISMLESKSSGMDFIEKIVYYITNIADIRNPEKDPVQHIRHLAGYLSDNSREDIMTLADRIRRQGIEKGISRGVEITAMRMLKENVDINFIARITGLSIEVIKNLEAQTHNENIV